MNKIETAAILALLQLEYPASFKNFTEADIEAKVNSWALQFADENYEEVAAAVQALIATRTVGYAPVIGEIREKLTLLREPTPRNDQEAWALVAKACRNGIYGYKREFSRLPPDVQAAVGCPEQLREWAMVDTDTLQTVVASNFMRGFRAAQQRNQEFSKLPASVKKMISDIGEQKKLQKKE